MSVAQEKEKHFVMKYIFTDVKNQLIEKEHGTEMTGPVEEHHGAQWQLRLVRNELLCNNHIDFHLDCVDTEQSCDWSIETELDVFADGNKIWEAEEFIYSEEYPSNDYCADIRLSEYERYSTNDRMPVEFHVTIKKMTGIEKKKLQNFDDDASKEHSDVMLKIGDQKFYVYKSYLCRHSSFFQTLFSGKFSEAGKSEVELKDVDPEQLQNFLELIYGISSVNDNTVAGLIELADYFQAPIAMHRCERFLLSGSHCSLKFKLQAAIKYKWDMLKSKCMAEMNSVEDFRDLSPENANDYSQDVWKELYDNVMSKL